MAEDAGVLDFQPWEEAKGLHAIPPSCCPTVPPSAVPPSSCPRPTRALAVGNLIYPECLG